MINFIKENDLRPLDDPGDGWYMIEANGEHPTTLENGKQIIQVLDQCRHAGLVPELGKGIAGG